MSLGARLAGVILIALGLGMGWGAPQEALPPLTEGHPIKGGERLRAAENDPESDQDEAEVRDTVSERKANRAKATSSSATKPVNKRTWTTPPTDNKVASYTR